jgi:hypothetical protein
MALLRRWGRRIVGPVRRILRGIFHIFLDVADFLSPLARDLLSVALRFLRRVIGHFANTLIDLAFDLLAYTFDLIFIQGLAPEIACRLLPPTPN